MSGKQAETHACAEGQLLRGGGKKAEESRKNASHYLSPPLLTLPLHSITPGEEGRRHSQANCPLAYGHFRERFEQFKREGESCEVVFESVVPARQQVAQKEGRRRRSRGEGEESSRRPLRVGQLLNFVVVSLIGLSYELFFLIRGSENGRGFFQRDKAKN